jgi:hypothetical protein
MVELRSVSIALLSFMFTLAVQGVEAVELKACSIEPLLKSVRSLEQFLVERRKVSFYIVDPSSNIHLHGDGTFTINAMLGAKCERPGVLTFSRNTASGECLVITRHGEPTVVDRTPWRVSVMVTSADSRFLVGSVEKAGKMTKGVFQTQEDGSFLIQGDGEDLVEVIPGARDRTLFERVKQRLLQPDAGRCRALFEGPQAKDVRSVSEIFYSKPAAKDLAERTAADLAPIIGPVEVKEWPGTWLYGVVVVVGDTVAGRK